MLFDLEVGLAIQILYLLYICPREPKGGCSRVDIPYYIVTHYRRSRASPATKFPSSSQLDDLEGMFSVIDDATTDASLRLEVIKRGVFHVARARHMSPGAPRYQTE